MSEATKKYTKFGAAISVIVLTLAYLAFLGAQESKSYYVTIKELHGMGDVAYTRHLQVGGIVQPGTLKMNGPQADFILAEDNDELKIHEKLHVIYKGHEPPPDTFKDNAMALAIGGYKRDGVFYATELQAKCASKYVAQPQQRTSAEPQSKTN